MAFNSTTHWEPLSLVVNAGGASRRMGRAKAMLPMPRTGTPLIVHIIRRLLPLVTERVVVVTNDSTVAGALANMDNLVVVRDRWVGGGALGGVATGLSACSGWAMVVACDMPFVDATIFSKQAEVAFRCPALDAVIPRVQGQGQPFHGVWHVRTVPALAARLEAGQLGVQAALDTLDVKWMDEEELELLPSSIAFHNVNTPQEWAALQTILEEQDWPVAG